MDLAHSHQFFASLRENGAISNRRNNASGSLSAATSPIRLTPRGLNGSRNVTLSATNSPQATFSPTRSHRLTVSTNPVSGGSTSGPSSQLSRIWEPPLSCQRRLLVSSESQLVFPLELTTRDYYHRLLVIFISGIRHLDLSYLQIRLQSAPVTDSNSTSDDFGAATGELMNIVLSMCSQREAASLTESLSAFYRQNSVIRSAVDSFAMSICQARESFCTEGTIYDDGELNNECWGQIWDNLRQLLSTMRNFSTDRAAAINTRNSFGRLQTELSDLGQQFRLHRQFKEQRIVSLGWERSREDSRSEKDSLALRAKSALEKAETLLQAVEQKCAPTPVGYPSESRRWLVYTKLTTIQSELALLIRERHDDNDFSEAHRLRELLRAIEVCILPSNIVELDQGRQDMTSLQLCCEELRSLAARLGARLAIELCDSLEQCAARCDKVVRVMSSFLSSDAIIFSGDARDRMTKEGTFFVTADWIFKAPSDIQKTTLAEIVVAAGQGELLATMEGWPGFSSLSRSVNHRTRELNGQQINDMSLSQSFSTTSHGIFVDLSRTEMDSVESNHPRTPRSPSHVQNLGVSNMTGLNSPKGLSKLAINSAAQFVAGSGQTPTRRPVASSAFSTTGRMSVDDFGPLVTSPMPTVNGGVVSVSSSYVLPYILDALRSFEALAAQLEDLLTPVAMSHTELLMRLLGIREDLHELATTSSHDEHVRLSELVSVLDQTVDADEEDLLDHDLEDTSPTLRSSIGLSHDLSASAIGRGRKRIDNIWELCQQVRAAIIEVQRLQQRARISNDFTSAKSLATMANQLETCVGAVELTIKPFSLLDADTDLSAKWHSDDGTIVDVRDVDAAIAQEGTSFITSDFLFACSCGPQGHSIGSLAILAGTGAILRFIRRRWPNLTALSANLQSIDNTQDGFGISSQMDSEGTAGLVDFRDAASLRKLGFDPSTLQAAGFSDVDILTAGFTAEQLGAAGFSAEHIAAAGGLTASATTAVALTGNVSPTRALNVLAELYLQCGGNTWRNAKHWDGVLQLNDLYLSGSDRGTRMQQREVFHSLISRAFGISLSADNSGFLEKIILPQNYLTGPLPSSIGSLITVRQLVLSNNHLSGPIPSEIGHMEALEVLCLDHNSFSGELPRTLKNLYPRLTVLRLEHNQLTGQIPSSLACLSSLRRLDLSNNRFFGPLPQRFGTGLTSLTELLLANNRLTGEIPASWAFFPQLAHLELQGNCLSGYLPNEINRLGKLSCLNLADNKGLKVDRIQLQRCLPKCRIKLA